jgi:hypothetical protein
VARTIWKYPFAIDDLLSIEMPWPFSTPIEELDLRTAKLNLPTPDGIEAGSHLDRFCQVEIGKGKRDERCWDCAFRATAIPNGCVPTVMDAIKCLAEDEPFHCHVKAGQPVCAGYSLLKGHAS